MSDVLLEMFAELRNSRPPVHDCDQWQSWISALQQVIQALPTYDQRWASVALVAQDMALAMGIPLEMSYRSLAGLLLDANDRQGVNR